LLKGDTTPLQATVIALLKFPDIMAKRDVLRKMAIKKDADILLKFA